MLLNISMFVITTLISHRHPKNRKFVKRIYGDESYSCFLFLGDYGLKVSKIETNLHSTSCDTIPTTYLSTHLKSRNV